MVELITTDPLRLRRALLTHMMHAGCVLIDLDSFDFPIEAIEEQFSKVERGLFQKLADRSALYSYLLPRRFKSLITTDILKDYEISAFMDENLQKFSLGFVTSRPNPDFDFAKQFYTISVKGSGEDEEEEE
mmetsp:Transcript_102083/g.292934  ORF Transcript_102083/g.292934 Transcript_102083/m.292934 type:complete len:131 (+) Transcript_102083:581-973(+)